MRLPWVPVSLNVYLLYHNSFLVYFINPITCLSPYEIAIECFDGASAVVVPRTRFAPVKKCNDLLLLRSDAYIITKDFRPMLNPLCNDVAPIIDLDSKNYPNVSALEAATANGCPSPVACKRLKLKGVVHFDRSTRIVGCVSITNSSKESKYVSCVIEDEDIDMTA